MIYEGMEIRVLHDLTAIQIGVCRDVADPEDEYDDGDTPKRVNGETANTEEQSNRQHRYRGGGREATIP